MSHNLDKINEEFNNFMQRVNEVSSIINNLSSNDRQLQEIGNLEAHRYLDGTNKQIDDNNQTEITIKTDRTVLNTSALHKIENPATLSQEAFMAEISRDADNRYRDRLKRTEHMRTLLKQGNLAFRRDEYEKASILYSRAIDEIRDNPTLYLNRALAYIRLNCYDKAINDANWALKLNDNSLKAWLLLSQAQYNSGDFAEYDRAILEAKRRHPDNLEFIEDFVKTIQSDRRI